MLMRRHCAMLGLLVLVPLAAPAQETCKPVPYNASSTSPPGLALSADDSRLVAGSPSENKVSVFKDPFAEPDGSPLKGSGGFGASVSVNGGWMAVGAPEEGGVGAVYLVDSKGMKRPLPPPGLRPGARFGASVALGKNWLVVGAPEDGAAREGAAYVFSTHTWELEKTLHPADGRLNDRFGTAVAVDENTVVVGAPYADDLKVFYNFGAVYVFDAGSGAQTAKLRAADDIPPG